MDIKNINDLRTHAVNTLKDLEKQKIDVVEAGVIGKLYENIMSSLKTEMEYHKMLNRHPEIKFLEGAKYEKIPRAKELVLEGKKT